MNVSPVASTQSRPQSVMHVRPTSWRLQERALFPVLVALVAYPTFVFAAPPTPRLDGLHIAVGGIHPRQDPGPDPSPSPSSSPQNSNNNSPGNGSISMNVWLPILLVTIFFVLFSFVTCIRRCAAADAASSARTHADRTESTPDGGITTRPRRRPRRTPSQISTKSLPPYMKEPGDHELVLVRGPSDMEDDMPMPTLAEDDDERPEMRGVTFDVALDRVETGDTMPDSSTTHLIRGALTSVPRPPELHHAAMPGDHRRSGDGHSLDSMGSETELLATHQRNVSGATADPRGEAPAYTEAVSAESGMTIISLNDPEPNNVTPTPGGRRSRFSFLMHNPFSSQNDNRAGGASTNANPSTPSIRSESPALHARSGSALSRIPTHESHDSRHSRTPSGNNNLSRSHSRSNLFRAFRSHSPGLPAGSTISLDSISAPLTHTATRAEFYSPKGGLLTAEQIKLITSREALDRFGVPYGPDAVAASRERMEPPPNFESVTGGQQEQSGATAARSETQDALPRWTSHDTVERAGSSASAGTMASYATALESDGIISRMQSEDGVDEPRPMRISE